MNITASAHRTYSVAVDRHGIRRTDMGPAGPLGVRVRCFVPLSGEVDE